MEGSTTTKPAASLKAAKDDFLTGTLQRLAADGGPLGWAKHDEVITQLDDVVERLANLAGDVGDVASAEGDDIEIPFAVDSEHVAVIGLLAQELREAASALNRFADSIAGAQWSIDRVRRNQEASRGR